MDFGLSPEQDLLQGVARDFFAAHSGVDAARESLESGLDAPACTSALAGAGLLDVIASGSLVDVALVAEQSGAVLATAQMVAVAQAASLLGAAANRGSALAARLLDDLLAARTHLAVVSDLGAYSSPSGGLSLDSGPVLGAAGADGVLLRRDGDLVYVSLGADSTRTCPPLDPTRRLAWVHLQDAPTVALLGAPDAAEAWARSEAVARVVLAAEDLGALGATIASAVAYSKDRLAFGRPIGSFQAIKHSLVDSFVAQEQARSLVWLGAWSADADPDWFPLNAYAAKVYCSEALEKAAATLIQVHGGVGFTWEHHAHLFWRRGQVDRLLLGDAPELKDRIGADLLARADATGS